MDRLETLRTRERRWVVGLNAGTSLDGIDAALVEIQGSGFDVKLRLAHFLTHPLGDALSDRLRALPEAKAPEICALGFELGERFGDAALALAAAAGLAAEDIDLIGSHGVTAFHQPPTQRGERGSTLQIGELDAIASRSGAVVVGDFRTADVAIGGQGAPLMPYLDFLLFREQGGVLAVNLGGIANLAWVGDQLEEVLGFDTGPANLPLDAIAKLLSRGERAYDAGGELAAAGHIDGILLEHLMALPYVLASPPKTTGRELFGEDWLQRLLASFSHLKLQDILATLTAFTAQALRQAVTDWVEPRPLRRVVVSGGGVHNLTLMRHLQRAFAPVPVEVMSEGGIGPDAKEAVLFATLANDRIHGRPTNVPSVSGAKWPISMGKIVA